MSDWRVVDGACDDVATLSFCGVVAGVLMTAMSLDAASEAARELLRG